MQIQFASNSYKLKSTPASAQVCINYYAEREPEDAKSPMVMFGAPGLTSLVTVGNGPIRGARILNKVLYVVSGNELYSVSSTYSTNKLGENIVGSAPVSMADNGTQVCVVNGVNGFIYDTSSVTFSKITSPNFFPANTVTALDGYFLFEKIGTNVVFFSHLLDGTQYNSLDFFSANVDSSLVLATVNQQQNLLVFKENIIETWYDSGDLNTPFQRFNGATVERGCGAPLSVIKEDNSVFFLGNDRIAYRLDATHPSRISQPAIEQEWQTYKTVSDCSTFKVTFEGHKFIVWNFPTANETWLYDIETVKWHQRISYAANAISLGRWRGNASAVFNGITVVGDAFTNRIGALSSTAYDEFGFQMIGQLVSPPIHSDRRRLFMNVFEVDIESGIGLATGQGSDPQIMLDWSDDGGRTFKNLQQWKSMGAVGAYLTRLRWTRLGNFRQRYMRLTVSDPVRRTIIAAHADIEKADL